MIFFPTAFKVLLNKDEVKDPKQNEANIVVSTKKYFCIIHNGIGNKRFFFKK